MSQSKPTDDSTPLAHELTRFQLDTLTAVAAIGPCKGSTIKSELESQMGRLITHPQLYNNLDALANKGLVEKEIRAIDGRSNSYEVTGRGRSILEARRAWLTEQLDGGEQS